jgi:alkanesulfonate monooxygenase SsuD/methylene tetrahydromethanopterin reductase-like flavin-dependent oxidoreductase (luciferase family)
LEFGVFVQGYTPQFRRDVDPDAEHHALINELELVRAADTAGFKYVWVTEHHFLDEYSHLSASDVVLGYLAHATSRIHIGSGIFNPLARVNHPVKVAERVAMLDHLSNGRFEFGTGRGAGSHEILGFLQRDGISDTAATREMWEETIGEFAKMWLCEEYPGFEGRWWSLPPRKVLPKPWRKPHPPMWYAAGNTTSWAMAARKGLGVLGFSVQSIDQLGPVIEAYKKEIPNAQPAGAYVNDNIMVTPGGVVAEDRQTAFARATAPHNSYIGSLLYRYHDTFPRPAEVPAWPELIPDQTADAIPYLMANGRVMGDPDDALEQCRRWESAGADQVVFGLGITSQDHSLETIRLMGEYVIPRIDKDPVHRTARFRDGAGTGGHGADMVNRNTGTDGGMGD